MKDLKESNFFVFNLSEESANSKVTEKEPILKLLKEISNKEMDREVVDRFRKGRKNG